MMGVAEWLTCRSNHGAQYWMDHVGNLIYKCTNDETRESDVRSWLELLVEEVWDEVKGLPIYDWRQHDENIVISCVLGVILSLWSCRIIRAKSYDKRRSLESRELMMKKLLALQHVLFECTVDEAHDHEYFPAQEWDSPYLERTRSNEQETEASSDENKRDPHT